MCRVAWFYLPEDLDSGRKSFHGRKELLDSEHEDPVPVGSIIYHIRVHSLMEYEALETIGKPDHFRRFFFNTTTRNFVPDQVPVLCVCRMPYNPDNKMVGCDTCGEWYHISCLNSHTAAELAKHPGHKIQCSMCAAKESDLSQADGLNKRVLTCSPDDAPS
ncbi:MAG: hypothetical protein WDW38_010516 [Sanguina aurantia]